MVVNKKYKIFYDEFGDVVYKEKIEKVLGNKDLKEIDDVIAKEIIKDVLVDGVLNLSKFENLEIIDYNAFADLKIKKIILPKKLKMIGSLAFANNLINDLDLSEIENLEVIENYAFLANPLSLEKIKLPKNIKSIGERIV